VAVKNAHNTSVTEMENIKNLTDYYNFLNYFVLWVPEEDKIETYIYRMLCTIYFVLDKKTVLPFHSAADSTFDSQANIDDGSIVILKGLPWNIAELLKDSKYANNFAGGKFMHAFLGLCDYHCQHAPVSGTVLEAKVILGQIYLKVVANGKSLKPIRKISDSKCREICAPNSVGYQFSQTHGLIVINSTIGMVAVLPIGIA
jgi:hypothetical protein